MKNLLLFLVAALFATTAHAQTTGCVGAACQVQHLDKQLAERLARVQAEGPSSNNAVQCLVGGSCGSGSVCGEGLILTNAHVVGTRVGRQVTVRVRKTGQTITGRIIAAAYSDRFLTDWAVVRCERGLETIEPVKLSKDKPVFGEDFYTTGSPRCVWPLRSQGVVLADIRDNSPLVRWRPDAIGGQSGSALWSTRDNLQKILLTWSWGGLGAGQQTAEIWRQARQRSIEGPLRIPGLVELAHKRKDKSDKQPVIVENGFFVQTNVNIADLPIWYETPVPDPNNPVDPNLFKLTEDEQKVIRAMRQVNRDYSALVNISLGIFALGKE